jgi:hypothetical protein
MVPPHYRSAGDGGDFWLGKQLYSVNHAMKSELPAHRFLYNFNTAQSGTEFFDAEIEPPEFALKGVRRLWRPRARK